MIVGGRIVSAEAKKNREENATGLNISVSIDSLSVVGGDLEVKYTYIATYDKDVGTLKISGVITEKVDNPSKIVSDWNKAKDEAKKKGKAEEPKLPNELAEELLNAINYTCSVNGALVMRALNLAPPMIFPRIQISKEAPGSKPAS